MGESVKKSIVWIIVYVLIGSVSFLYHKSVSNRYQIDTWKLALIFLR